MSTWMETYPSATGRMWSAASPRTDRNGRVRPAKQPRRRAVEKPGPWTPWKTKNRFPTVPTVPWKSRSGIPTFPPPRRFSFPSTRGRNRAENPDPPVLGAQRVKSSKPDRSCVNQTGQIDKLRTAWIDIHDMSPGITTWIGAFPITAIPKLGSGELRVLKENASITRAFVAVAIIVSLRTTECGLAPL
jgi:hypothetical protein